MQISPFAKVIKELFRLVCRLAKSMGMIQLGEIMFGGTSVKANNTRNETAAATLEKQMAALEAELEKLWQVWELGDEVKPKASDYAHSRRLHLAVKHGKTHLAIRLLTLVFCLSSFVSRLLNYSRGRTAPVKPL